MTCLDSVIVPRMQWNASASSSGAYGTIPQQKTNKEREGRSRPWHGEFGVGGQRHRGTETQTERQTDLEDASLTKHAEAQAHRHRVEQLQEHIPRARQRSCFRQIPAVRPRHRHAPRPPEQRCGALCHEHLSGFYEELRGQRTRVQGAAPRSRLQKLRAHIHARKSR
jgi:hypothetical protein